MKTNIKKINNNRSIAKEKKTMEMVDSRILHVTDLPNEPEAARDPYLTIVLEEEEEVKLSLCDDVSINTDFIWSSDHEEIAKVNGMGVVTAILEGITRVFARRIQKNFEEYVKVKVVPQGEGCNHRLAVYLHINETVRLFVEGENIIWSSMDPGKAIVSNTGEVTAISEGLVLISAKVNDEIKVIYVRVKGLSNKSNVKATKISASVNYSLLTTESGQSFAWGLNNYGQFGLNTIDNSNVPIKAFNSLINVSNVAAGANHAFVLTENGELWAAGYNNYGQLGNASVVDSKKPVKVLEGVYAISTRNNFSLAVKNNSELWAWGYNGNYQLGNNTTTNSNIPVKILDNVSAVSAGASHSLALKHNGELWAWGLNSNYQLGDGSNTTRTTPQKIMTGVSAISAGDNYSAAVKDNGELWVWGYNGYGQLGNGTTTNSTVPIKVMNNVISVSAGANHTLAITVNNQLFAWGINTSGQLGNGTVVNNYVPSHILDNVIEISAGNTHSLVLTKDGIVWAYGNNSTGLLGNGTNINSLEPLQVIIRK